MLKFLLTLTLLILLSPSLQESIPPGCSTELLLAHVEVTKVIGSKSLSIYNQRLTVPPEVSSFVLNCSFHKPIKWGITKSLKPNYVTSVEKTRSFVTHGNLTSSCFSVNLVFSKIQEEITALYKCYPVDAEDFEDESVVVELFSGSRPTQSEGYLIHRGKMRQMFKSVGNKIISLECMVNYPDAQVDIYFAHSLGENATEWVPIPPTDYKFDPIRETALQRSFIENRGVSQFYLKCETKVRGDFVLFNYTEQTLWLYPRPGKTLIYSLSTSLTHDFTCTSSQNISMKVDSDIEHTNYEISYSSSTSTFTAMAKVAYLGSPGDTSSRKTGLIQCLNNNTVLHSWRHRLHYDTELRSDTGLRLDSRTRTVTCHSTASEDILIRYIACETMEECQLKGVCTRDYGTICPDMDLLTSAKLTPTTKSVKLPARSGQLICTGLDLSNAATFFLNTDRSTISKLVFDELSQVGVNITNELRCDTTSPKVGDRIECTCLLGKRFYAMGPTFHFLFVNSSSSPIHQDLVTSRNCNFDHPSFHCSKSHIRITSLDILAISCLGLFTQSENSSSTHVSMNVTLHKLRIHGKAVETISLPDFDLNLTCLASSFPLPNITWISNNNVLNPSQVSYRILNETTLQSTLRLPHHPHFHQNFSCGALSDQTQYGGHILRENKLFLLHSKELPGSALSTVEISGIAIGTSIVCLLAVITIIVKRKRRKSPKKLLTQKDIQDFIEGNPNIRGENGYENAQRMPFAASRYQIDLTHLQIKGEEVLGSGAYGIVLKGSLSGTSEKEIMDVAVKMVKPDAEVEYLRALLGELKVMTYIGSHLNVAELIGAVTSGLAKNELYVVLKYYENGGLKEFLKANRRNFINIVDNGLISPTVGVEMAKKLYENCTPVHHSISTLNLIQWASEIGSGMEYLSTKKVIHGDLAARNVLLDEFLVAKISDFGLSRQLYQYAQYVKTSKEPLPWRWLSLEVLCDMTFSVKSDVWAFGVTIWEIFSLGEVPYPGLNLDEDYITMLKAGYRMSKPQTASDECFSLMLDCWLLEADDRPDFAQITQSFGNVLRSTLVIVKGMNTPKGLKISSYPSCESIQYVPIQVKERDYSHF